jgi:hypothetical protein
VNVTKLGQDVTGCVKSTVQQDRQQMIHMNKAHPTFNVRLNSERMDPLAWLFSMGVSGVR